MQRPTFSPGANIPALDASLAPLLGGRWALTSTGEGIERTFKFKTFARTWDFMTSVSLQCKIKNHHPEWSNVYNIAYIRWTTHNPKGLSAKDIEMAAVCDAIAKDFGEIKEAPEEAKSCSLSDLVSSVTASPGDCCGPKDKGK